MPEMTRTRRERMDLVALLFLCAVVGAGLGLVAGGVLRDALGFQVAGTLFAALALVFRYVSLGAIWNRAPRDIEPARAGFWRGYREVMSNSQFVAFLPTFVMFATGVGILQGWVPFFAVGVLAREGAGMGSSLVSMSVISGVVLAGVFTWVLVRRGRLSKRRVYGFCLVGSGLFFPLVGLGGSGDRAGPAGAGPGVRVRGRNADVGGVRPAQGSDRRHRGLRRLGEGRAARGDVLRGTELLREADLRAAAAAAESGAASGRLGG